MRFELTQRYRSAAPAVDDAYADADLYPTLVGLPKLGGIEVLSHQRTADRAVLRNWRRLTPISSRSGGIQMLGAAAAAATSACVRSSTAARSTERPHRAAGRPTCGRGPHPAPDRLKASGHFAVRATPDGSERRVTGELKVKAFLVAGQVEQAIVSGLEESLVAEAPPVDRYLDA